MKQLQSNNCDVLLENNSNDLSINQFQLRSEILQIAFVFSIFLKTIGFFTRNNTFIKRRVFHQFFQHQEFFMNFILIDYHFSFSTFISRHINNNQHVPVL